MAGSMKLEDIDVDGAIRETAAEAGESLGDTRRGLMKKTALAGGAMIGGGSILGAIVAGEASAAGKGRPPASFGKGDIGILNYALTLEYLEAAFYNEALAFHRKTNFIKDRQTEVFLKTVVRDENAHVKALKKVLGGKGKASLWRKGTVPLGRFIDRNGEPLTLAQMERIENEIRDGLRADRIPRLPSEINPG